MNASINAKEFSSALSRVMKLTARRSALPILGQVKVSFTGTSCTLAATDFEQWGVIELPAGGDAFSFMLGNAKEVLKMLGKQAGTLYISFASGENPPGVKLACGGRESRFLVDPARDYPETPPVEALQTYHVDSGALLEKVNAVSYAACANPESRQTLCGVHFLGREVYCVDNCRMAVADNGPLEAAAPFSVPARMFKNWNTLFPTGEVTLDVGKRYLRASGSGITALFRLLECETLRPQNVFPTSCRERYQVDPKEYARELRYLSGFVTHPARQPVVFRNGRLAVQTDNGEYSGTIHVEGTAETVYGFQADLMLEAMEHFGDQGRVTVEVSHPKGPIVLRADDGRKTLVLPMRLTEETRKAA